MAAVFACSELAHAQALRTPAPHKHGPVTRRHTNNDGTAYSTDWSGYAVASPITPATPTSPTGVTVTYVSGSWVVPPLAKDSCTKKTSDEYASFWIGIDGWYSNTVEQIGTDSDCSSGAPSYYAWYEFYPLDPGYPTGELANLNPGDVMTASVTYHAASKTKRASFTATITDVTQDVSFSTTFHPNAKTGTPQLSSAEWIAEACCGLLADFGTVAFRNDTATVNNAIAPGSSGALPIGSFGSNNVIGVWTCTLINENTPETDIESGRIPVWDIMAAPLIPPGLIGLSDFAIRWYSLGP
jgi:hypothetical protein